MTVFEPRSLGAGNTFERLVCKFESHFKMHDLLLLLILSICKFLIWKLLQLLVVLKMNIKEIGGDWWVPYLHWSKCQSRYTYQLPGRYQNTRVYLLVFSLTHTFSIIQRSKGIWKIGHEGIGTNVTKHISWLLL